MFVGRRFNVALAAWLAPLFPIRFFRDCKHWDAALPAVPLLALASYVQLAGGWDLDAWMYPVFSLLRPVALGDWFAWLASALVLALFALACASRRSPAVGG